MEQFAVQFSIDDALRILDDSPIRPDLATQVTLVQITNRVPIAHLAIERALKFLIQNTVANSTSITTSTPTCAGFGNSTPAESHTWERLSMTRPNSTDSTRTTPTSGTSDHLTPTSKQSVRQMLSTGCDIGSSTPNKTNRSLAKSGRLFTAKS